MDDFIADQYTRRFHTASRVHASVKMVVECYDIVVLPALKPWGGRKGWSSSTRAQWSAARLQGLQTDLKALCDRRGIIPGTLHHPDLQCLNSVGNARFYKCQNKECAKVKKGLITHRDADSALKIAESYLLSILQSRKETLPSAIAAKDHSLRLSFGF